MVLRKIRMLPTEHPEVYAEFLQGKFVVQTHTGSFKATSPDMKLEQTIVGQAKADSYVTEWELVYHEILAISNCFRDLTNLKLELGLSYTMN